jgi:hypothetical protein
MSIQVHGLLGEEPSELVEEELGGRIHGGVPKSIALVPDVSNQVVGMTENKRIKEIRQEQSKGRGEDNNQYRKGNNDNREQL